MAKVFTTVFVDLQDVASTDPLSFPSHLLIHTALKSTIIFLVLEDTGSHLPYNHCVPFLLT